MENAWNYISRTCPSPGWLDGATIALDDCHLVEDTGCPSFVSAEDKSGVFTNTTVSLPSGTYCNVEVDARSYIGHVIFENSDYLGIERDGVRPDDVITINSGTENITIFNAASTGPITFKIAFSGASSMVFSAVTLTALTLLSF